mgnify:CR=1 FL=1
MRKVKRVLALSLLLLVIMAITSCGEKKSSDSESADNIEIELDISYEEQSGLNYNDDAIVYLDDEEIGKVEYGSMNTVLNVKTSEGDHTLRLISDTTIRKNKSNKVTISVGDETKFDLRIYQHAIWGLRLEMKE